jgi:hypothetical protein
MSFLGRMGEGRVPWGTPSGWRRPDAGSGRELELRRRDNGGDAWPPTGVKGESSATTKVRPLLIRFEDISKDERKDPRDNKNQRSRSKNLTRGKLKIFVTNSRKVKVYLLHKHKEGASERTTKRNADRKQKADNHKPGRSPGTSPEHPRASNMIHTHSDGPL